jgi:hypothetical protein
MLFSSHLRRLHARYAAPAALTISWSGAGLRRASASIASQMGSGWGYGCYVRNGVAHGFFLEYDRGTESTRTYLAKFRAYYSYRDSRQADRDYNGFPTLLFVTTRPQAEERIADAAHRAWFLRGTQPLAVLITTTSRITSDRQAILGRIWRRPGQIGATPDDERQYWLTDGATGKLVGAGCESAITIGVVHNRFAAKDSARLSCQRRWNAGVSRGTSAFQQSWGQAGHWPA